MILAEILAELDSIEARRRELVDARKQWHQNRRLPCRSCKRRSVAKKWTRVYYLYYEESGHNGDWLYRPGRYIECPHCKTIRKIPENARGYGPNDIPDEAFVLRKDICEQGRYYR